MNVLLHHSGGRPSRIARTGGERIPLLRGQTYGGLGGDDHERLAVDTGRRGTALSGGFGVNGVAVPQGAPEAAGASGSSVSTVCVLKKSGAMRVASPGAKCTKRERVMTLNLIGPQGAPGTPGAVGQGGQQGPTGATGPVGAPGSGQSSAYLNATAGDVKPPAGMSDFSTPIAVLTLPAGDYALEGRLHFQLGGSSPGMCALVDLTTVKSLGSISVPVSGATTIIGAVTVPEGSAHEVQLRCNFPGTSSYAKDPALQAISMGSVTTQ